MGLFRPITLNPFPYARIKELSDRSNTFLVIEMNSGQMLEDVIKAVGTLIPIEFYGRLGGVVPFPDEVLSEIMRIVATPPSINLNPRASWLTRVAIS